MHTFKRKLTWNPHCILCNKEDYLPSLHFWAPAIHFRECLYLQEYMDRSGQSFDLPRGPVPKQLKLEGIESRSYWRVGLPGCQ